MADSSSDLPTCQFKPLECNADHRHDQGRPNRIDKAGYVRPVRSDGYQDSVLRSARWREAMPQHRSHAILLDSLKRILSPIDRSSLDGKRDHALLLLGFAAGLRAGELSRLTAGQFRDRYRTPLSVHIRGNQLKGPAKTIVIRRGRSQVTDPLFALEEWLAATGIRGEDPLFQHISQKSQGAAANGRLLSPSDIGNIVRRRAADAGWDDPHLTGNSLRNGHIITLLAEGDVDL